MEHQTPPPPLPQSQQSAAAEQQHQTQTQNGLARSPSHPSSVSDDNGEVQLPPELPLTPQSNNKGPLTISVSDHMVNEVAASAAGALQIQEVQDATVALASPTSQGEEGGVEILPPALGLKQQPLQDGGVGGGVTDKSYTRNMSGLSVSTGEVDSTQSISYEEDAAGNLLDTPKSSLNSSSGKKQIVVTNDVNEGGGAAAALESETSSISAPTPTPTSTASGVTVGGVTGAAVGVGGVAKTVDWIPQQQQQQSQTLQNETTKSETSGVTSQAVRMGDDVTETSFTTMTSSSPLPPPPSTGGGARPTRSSLRSPRPPRHMRAVDWCPPNPPNATPTSSTNNHPTTGTGTGSSSGRVSIGGSSSVALASDKTAISAVSVVTSRAVRLGDEDATVTTFATMTTMGDAGSILEADTEEEASHSSSSSGGGSANRGSGDSDRSNRGSDVEAIDADVEVDGGGKLRAASIEEEEQSMEDVQDEDGIVDKIPSLNSKRGRNSSLSGTTQHAVRAVDDQSVVTFATMTTVGGMDRNSSGCGADVVDKVPSLPPVKSMRDDTSIVTNDTVQMGDNQSLATWATTNTMGGQLVGNMVDHVPSENDKQGHHGEGAEGSEGDGEGGGQGSHVDSSSSATVGTSNAVKEDPSVTTFTTAAETNAGESTINEVVDKIPTFAGGGGGGGNSSSAMGSRSLSGVTNQAVRMGVGVPDDRSVASFATMTTMGDLGSIFETEVLEPEDMNTMMLGSTNNRTRLFSNDEIIETSGMIDRAVVDVIPESTTSSVASGTTNHSVRTGGEDSASVTTFGTMTTAGDRGGGGGTGALRVATEDNPGTNGDVVDKVPMTPTEGTSVVSGTTNHAVRLNDDQSVATWATTQTSGGVVVGHVNEHVVDKIPSFRDESSKAVDNNSQSMATEVTNAAIKDPEDSSVVTWNTMTTAGGNNNNRLSSISNISTTSLPQLQQPPPGPYAVDRVPSSNRGGGIGQSVSATTNQAVRASDDQSVVTFATMTTVGGMDRGGDNMMVDKVPSFAPRGAADTSIVTNDTVQMGDNQSLATWATTNTMGGQLTGNMVDHVPNDKKGEDELTVGTTNAVKEDPSVTTFTTSATSGGGVSAINEVVDKVPTFAGGGTGKSVTSGVTNQAVRGGGDDRSVTSFATMTTAGDMGSVYGADANYRRYSGNNERGSVVGGERPNLVDRIPSSTTSIISGRTENAVRLGDDLTVTTFATMTTAGGEGMAGDQRSDHSAQSATDENDVRSGGSVSSSSRFINAPTIGILRESRHSRPMALRSQSDSGAAAAAMAGADPNNMDLPINVGESVSNTHILRAIADLRFHVDYRMGEMREMNRRDSERVLQVIQQEQVKRTALEARLHSQLLLQSESMVAMELKLLRLEAKVSQRDSRRNQRRQPGGGVAAGTGGPAAPTPTITDRLPPIAATPSTPQHSDEEVDSFEELELTPRANRGSGSGVGMSGGLFTQGGGAQRGGDRGPANIAVVTRSGASVASAVTATSFQDGDFGPHPLMMIDDERSDDGDIEDDGDNDDSSASAPTQSSRNRISNLESILLNPINQTNSGNEQGISTRAVRGSGDADSSLPTSVTSATMASTVVTSTTRGNESVGITRISSRASEEDVLREDVEEVGVLRSHRTMRMNSEEYDMTATTDDQPEEERPRSRSQSPLTVQSAATGTQSMASASLGPSILSTAAVASSRSFGTRRVNAAIANAEAASQGSRSMANRVVSFTTNGLEASEADHLRHHSEEDDDDAQHHQHRGDHMMDGCGGDSITMPDELDNFSDVADAFSNSARAWREEYEARLDAIHKRLGN